MGLELNLFSEGSIEIRLPILSDRTALIIELIDAIFFRWTAQEKPLYYNRRIQGEAFTAAENTALLVLYEICMSKLGKL